MMTTIAILLALAVTPAPAATIHTTTPTRAPRFTREHVPSAPVVPHTWEIQDADGCVTRPLEGSDGQVRICG